MIDPSRFGYRDVSSEVLAQKLEAKQKEVKADSKKTIMDKFMLGGLLTKNQLDEIKSKIPAGSLKAIPVKQVTIDKNTGEAVVTEVIKYFNKHVVRTNAVIDKLSEGEVLNMNLTEAEHTAHMNSVNYDVYQGRAEIAALKAEIAIRDAEKTAKIMTEKNVQRETHKQIYERAVRGSKLTTEHQAAAVEEGDDVPTHSETTAIHADAVPAQ